MTTTIRMQQIRETAANWTAKNPVLLAGEIAVETDTLKVKVGDGVTPWNTLPYLLDGATGPAGPAGPAGPEGAPGTPGPNGREVEFAKSATHLQWRYVGDNTWIDLVALTELGVPGPPGIDYLRIQDTQPTDITSPPGVWIKSNASGTESSIYILKSDGTWQGIAANLQATVTALQADLDALEAKLTALRQTTWTVIDEVSGVYSLPADAGTGPRWFRGASYAPASLHREGDAQQRQAL